MQRILVFYDITTLYFESSSEDDFRKLGFSKDGKSNNLQILLELFVGQSGYPIGYEVFEGNKFEGHTLIPVLKKYEKTFNLSKPVIVADAGLLSKQNTELLEKDGYKYFLGGRIKNESTNVQNSILRMELTDGENKELKKE